MSKAPAMPMYWDAYLADTTHLTTEEHGAYMLLLAAMWRRNAWVPDDDKDNARILGLTPAKWRKIKARLMETVSGFRVENGKITQEKLQKTWEKTQEKICKNRSNGAKGGRPKSKENKDIAKANGSVSVNPNKSIPEPEPYSNTLEANASNEGQAFDASEAAIWKRGVPFLSERGVPEPKARQMIGKWIRDHGSGNLFSALSEAAKSGTGDPIPYITKILTQPAQPSVAEMVKRAGEKLRHA